VGAGAPLAQGTEFLIQPLSNSKYFLACFFQQNSKKSIFVVKAKNAWRAQPALNNEKLKTRGSVREEKNEVGLDARRRSAGCRSAAWGAR